MVRYRLFSINILTDYNWYAKSYTIYQPTKLGIGVNWYDFFRLVHVYTKEARVWKSLSKLKGGHKGDFFFLLGGLLQGASRYQLRIRSIHVPLHCAICNEEFEKKISCASGMCFYKAVVGSTRFNEVA